MTDKMDKLPTYRNLVERFFNDQVKGKANPYTSMNGNMYSFLDTEGRICLRMDESDRASFAAIFQTEPVQQYGATMRGYVAIPHDRLDMLDDLKAAFETCFDHAKSLPKK